MTRPDFEVAIIGAGPGGIAAAHLLQRRGIEDFVPPHGAKTIKFLVIDHASGLTVSDQARNVFQCRWAKCHRYIFSIEYVVRVGGNRSQSRTSASL